MRNKNTRPIDANRLNGALGQKGFTPSGASRELGLSESAISNWKKRGTIPTYGIKLLEGLGVEYEQYKPKDAIKKIPRELTRELTPDEKITNAISSVDTHLLMMYEELVKLNQFFERHDPAREKEDHED